MKKVIAIVATLLIVVAALGVGYARWFEVLYIDGSVQTGNVDVDIVGTGYDIEDKDVSAVEVTPWVAPQGQDGLQITVLNAYPSATYVAEWDVTCLGSIPVHVAHFWGDPLPPDYMLYDYLEWLSPTGEWVPVPDYVQLHEGEIGRFRLVFHFDNDLPQDTQIHFCLEIDSTQYNEANVNPPLF